LDGLGKCFSTGGPRSFRGGPPKAFLILLNIRISDTNFVKIIKSQPFSATKLIQKQESELILTQVKVLYENFFKICNDGPHKC